MVLQFPNQIAQISHKYTHAHLILHVESGPQGIDFFQSKEGLYIQRRLGTNASPLRSERIIVCFFGSGFFEQSISDARAVPFRIW